MTKSSNQSWFASASRWMRTTVVQAWKLIEAVAGWEGVGVAFLFPLGWILLERGNFPIARTLFTAASVFLAVRVISGARKLFHGKKSQLMASLSGILIVFGLWLSAWYWVLNKEIQSKKEVPPSFVRWLMSYFAWANNIPWRWVAPTAIVVFLITMLVNVLRERQRDLKPLNLDELPSTDIRRLNASLTSCPDPQTHKIKEADKASIKSLVRIPGIAYQPCFDPEGPYLDFVVSVFNGSLFDVEVNNSVGTGYIFNNTDSKKFYYPARIESDGPIRVLSRRDNFFTIRQALRFEEIAAFDRKNKVLSLGGLVITFTGQEIGETRLDTNHVIETNTLGWRAWDQLGFICSYSDERWAALQSGNVGHSIELAELRARLKDKDAAALVNSPPAAPPPPELRCDDQQFYDVTMKGDYYVKASSFDRRYRINKAAFADFKLKYDDTVGELIDLRAEIVLRNESGEAFHVREGVWNCRESKKVPLRHAETQSLILTVFDEDGVFYAYENQHLRNKPITVPMKGSVFTAEVIVTREYMEKMLPPVRWYFLLSTTAERGPAIKQIDSAGMQREADAPVV